LPTSLNFTSIASFRNLVAAGGVSGGRSGAVGLDSIEVKHHTSNHCILRANIQLENILMLELTVLSLIYFKASKNFILNSSKKYTAYIFEAFNKIFITRYTIPLHTKTTIKTQLRSLRY
jgi:hypothetical protein